MTEDRTSQERMELLAVRFRVLALLVADVLLLVVMGMRGIAWHDWVLLVVTMLLVLGGWVVWGAAPGGWKRASLGTWGLHVGCLTAMGMLAGSGAQALWGGLLLGTLWTLVVLGLLVIVTTVVREVMQWH